MQKADGTGIGCDGGSSCTVPEPGDYVAISFGSEVERTPISVRGSSSTGDNGSDNTANGGGDNTSSGGEAGDGYTVNNETLTISWTSTNWHQVQRSDGSSIGCDGGQSCTVPVPGDYIAISFGDSVIRTAVRVDGQAAFGDDTGGFSDSGGSSGSGSSNGDASTPVGEQQGDYYVDHAAQVVRWTVAGWHQVQMSDGTNIGCDGGNACSVPGTDNYVGINHDTGYRTPLVVRSESNQSDDSQSAANDTGNSTTSEGEQQGNYTVDHAALVIRWSTAGWHQIQKSDGTNIGCDGGNSCTVPSPGDYIGINHTSGLRTSLTVNGESSNSTNEPSDSNDSAGSGDTSNATEQDGDYTINHSARTISWSVSGWHQVQTSNGGDIGCSGGTSCTVPTDGNYIVINHGTGQRKTVTVGSASSVSINGDYTIDSSTKTISGTVSGWHQVQRSNGEDIECNGGYSCTVPEAGSYIAINHGTGSRTPLSVN